MSSTRTPSAPRSTMSRIAAQLSAARVSLFFCSRNPMRPPYGKVRAPQRCVFRKSAWPARLVVDEDGGAVDAVGVEVGQGLVSGGHGIPHHLDLQVVLAGVGEKVTAVHPG